MVVVAVDDSSVVVVVASVVVVIDMVHLGLCEEGLVVALQAFVRMRGLRCGGGWLLHVHGQVV